MNVVFRSVLKCLALVLVLFLGTAYLVLACLNGAAEGLHWLQRRLDRWIDDPPAWWEE